MRLTAVLAVVVLASCGGGSSPSAPVTPEEIPAPPTETVLIGAGDIGWKGSDVQRYTGKLVQEAVDKENATPFTAGDNAYDNGTYAEFMSNYHDFWGMFREKTIAVAGNHDYGTRDAAGFFSYFGDAADPDHTRTGWFAKRLPNVLVVVLNSNVDMGRNSRQVKWLHTALSVNPVHCTVAIWHHPRWSSGPNGDHEGTQYYWRELYSAGADAVVNAHEHSSERFAAVDADGKPDAQRGLRQFVAGGGGAVLKPLKVRKATSEFHRSTYAVLKLRFRAGSYRWEFIGLDGTVIDSTPGGPDAFEACH